MPQRISISILIDALGWKLLEDRQFLKDVLTYRYPLRTILGYSSAAVPSVLTGKMPNEHGTWSYFYYSPETSPFAWLAWLDLVPSFISDRGPFRRILRDITRWRCGYTGAFELYHVPLKYLRLFDFSLKRDVFQPGAFACSSVFDIWQTQNIDYSLLTWPLPDADCIMRTISSIQQTEKSHYFLYLPELDAALHRYGTRASEIDTKLAWYEQELRRILVTARKRSRQVDLHVFSDHGMTDTVSTVDLMHRVESLNLAYGRDYVGVYDSTMTRFWFFTDKARRTITEALQAVEQGRFLSDKELSDLGVYWADRRYGDAIFLMDPGVLVAPSYMSKYYVPAGMHGFHPDDVTCHGVFLSNVAPKITPQSITDILELIS